MTQTFIWIIWVVYSRIPTVTLMRAEILCKNSDFQMDSLVTHATAAGTEAMNGESFDCNL